jgi:hypothetical protein
MLSIILTASRGVTNESCARLYPTKFCCRRPRRRQRKIRNETNEVRGHFDSKAAQAEMARLADQDKSCAATSGLHAKNMARCEPSGNLEKSYVGRSLRVNLAIYPPLHWIGLVVRIGTILTGWSRRRSARTGRVQQLSQASMTVAEKAKQTAYLEIKIPPKKGSVRVERTRKTKRRTAMS